MTLRAGPAGRGGRVAAEGRSLLVAMRRRPRLRGGLVQIGYVVVGAALGVLTSQLRVGPTVGTDQLAAVFGGLGGGLIALISVVFALLFLVVQFAATTHSPRLTLFRDSPLVWHAFGLFVGTLVYVTTAVLASGQDQQVSVLVPVIGLLLVLISLATARRLQLSALNSLQLGPTLEAVAARGREVIDRLYPEPWRPATAPDAPPAAEPTDGGHEVSWDRPPSVLRQLDLPRLLAVAERLDGQIHLTVGAGDVLWDKAVIARLPRAASDTDREEVLGGFEAGIERSFDQDPLLAFRLLADIGLRALTLQNDPYTAVQSLDAIEGLLRRLTVRHLDTSVIHGAGRARIQLCLPSWEAFLQTGVDELTHAGQDIPTVRQRISRLLDDLAAISPPARIPPLDRRRGQLTDR